MHLGMFSILFNNRGEAGAGDPPPPPPPEKKFTQEDMDRTIGERIGRERAKYSGYDDLVKYKSDNESKLEVNDQKNKEERQEYDQLKKDWNVKEENFNKAIDEGKKKYADLRIDNALSVAINANNAYPEASHSLRNLVVIGEDGIPKMKIKDEIGNDAYLDLTEGVKKFLVDKQYLVKGAAVNGSGTPPASGGGGAGDPGGLDEWNAQLMKLQGKNLGNSKEGKELKAKIAASLATK